MSEQSSDLLCCCEYFDHENQRNHIITCCCNCVVFDQIAENSLCCRRSTSEQIKAMGVLLQDRLRIPWRGGAKIIPVDCLLPVILVPALLYIAAFGLGASIVVFLITIGGFVFFKNKIITNFSRTNFFFIWALWSAIWLLVIFQITLPLYEFLPEENIVFLLLFTVSLLLFYRTRRLSQKHNATPIVHGFDESEAVILIDQDQNVSDDKQSESSLGRGRNYSMLINNEYNYWVGAYIGPYNRRSFYYGCGFSVATLTFSSNLILTAICRPYLFATILGVLILLPDNCDEAYYLYDLSIGFVAGLYSIIIAIFCGCHMLRQICLICNRCRGSRKNMIARLYKFFFTFEEM